MTFHDIDDDLDGIDAEIAGLEAELAGMGVYGLALEGLDDDEDEVGLFKRKPFKKRYKFGRGLAKAGIFRKRYEKHQARRQRAHRIKRRGGRVRKIRIFKPGRVRKGTGFFGKRREIARKRLGLQPGFRKGLKGATTTRTVSAPRRRVVVRRGAGGRYIVRRPRVVKRVVRAPRVLQATGRPAPVQPKRPLGVPLGWFQPPGAPGYEARPGFTPMPGGPVPLGEFQAGFSEMQAQLASEPPWEGGYEDAPFGEPAEEVEYVDEFGAPIPPEEIEFAGLDDVNSIDAEIARLEAEHKAAVGALLGGRGL
jgi:hypothetical protein